MSRTVHLRDEPVADDAVIRLRAGVNGVAPAKLRSDANRSLAALGILGVSVAAALAGETLREAWQGAAVTAERDVIWLTTAGHLRATGFPPAPHRQGPTALHRCARRRERGTAAVARRPVHQARPDRGSWPRVCHRPPPSCSEVCSGTENTDAGECASVTIASSTPWRTTCCSSSCCSRPIGARSTTADRARIRRHRWGFRPTAQPGRPSPPDAHRAGPGSRSAPRSRRSRTPDASARTPRGAPHERPWSAPAGSSCRP